MTANDWESTITDLVEKWERLTRGKKPLIIEVTTFWFAGKPKRHDVYLSCFQENLEETNHFNASQDAFKWLAEQLSDMLEEEFRRQYAAQEKAAIEEAE